MILGSESTIVANRGNLPRKGKGVVLAYNGQQKWKIHNANKNNNNNNNNSLLVWQRRNTKKNVQKVNR